MLDQNAEYPTATPQGVTVEQLQSQPVPMQPGFGPSGKNVATLVGCYDQKYR